MRKLSLLLIFVMCGCSSLQNAGHSAYSAKPFMIDDKQVCCEVTISSGREVGSVKAQMTKTGDDFTFSIEVNGIQAFNGQAISAGAAGAIVPGVSNNIAGALLK